MKKKMIKDFNSASGIGSYIDSKIYGSFLNEDIEFLGFYVKQLKSGDKYMEVGTEYGKSIASAIWQAPEGIKFFTVDIEDHIVVDHAKLSRQEFFKTEGLDKVCTFIKGNSLKVVKNYPDNEFAMIFIDSEHTYEAGSKDIMAWTPKLKSGGFMVFHDYLDSQFTLREAIDQYIYGSGQFTNFTVAKNLGYGNSSMAGAVKK